MTDIIFKSALDLGKLLKARKLSAAELLDHCLTQFMRYNTKVNAVVIADLDRSRRAAFEADQRYAKGAPLSPFDGVPMTIKESFDWAGLPSTWGDYKMKDNIPVRDAAVLERMSAAGAVPYGKTNVPYHLTDWQSFNDIYGTTNNPWDESLTPGGSSGGAAAALATGMSALEVGSDIGASIRNPAHYCGVFGHKPTFGVVPYRGHLMPGSAALSDITVAGPMARSAKDLTAMMNVLVGSDGIDATAINIELQRSKRKTLKDFRVAVKLSSSISEVDEPYVKKITALANALKPSVKQLSFEAAPSFDDATAYENYILLLRATSAKRLTRAEYDKALALAESFDPGDKSYLALMNRGLSMSHRDWLRQNELRHQMRLLWDDFFENWDVLLCPCAASTAWPHDQKGERHERLISVNGKMVSTIDQRFWAGYSGNFYLPSTVAPIGLIDGLPCGVQIIARQYGDYESLRFAELIEEMTGGFVPPPGYG
jgi:amidase